MKKIWPLAVLAFFILIFFYRNIFLGEIFYFGDNLSLFLPSLTFFANQIKKGIFPLWNPYLFSGVPFLADIGLGLLNPFNFLFLIFSSHRAMSLSIIFQVFLAGFWTYLFLRNNKCSSLESLFGAITFAFSASILTFINNIGLLSTASFLPLVLLIGQKVLNKKSLSWAALLGGVMAIQFVSGHPQPAFYSYFLLGLYFLFYPKTSWKLKIKFGAVSLAFFLSLTAFQTLPTMELVQKSTRPLANFDYVTLYSFHPFLLIRFLLPWFFGAAIRGISWGPIYRMGPNNTGYFGLLSLLIIFFSFLAKKKKDFTILFFSFIFVLSVFLAMGKYTPVFSLFYRFFPGFSWFRTPTQILLLTNFSAAVLAAKLLANFLRILRFKKTGKIIAIALATNVLFIVLLGFVFCFEKNIFVIFYQWFGRLYFSVKKIPLSESPFHNFAIDKAIFSFMVRQFLVTFIFLLFFLIGAFLFQKNRMKKNSFLVIVLLLSFLCLFYFNRNNYFSAKPVMFSDQLKTAQFLQANIGIHRFISSSGYWPFTGLNVYWENMALRPPLADSIFDEKERETFTVLKRRLAVLPPNWGMKYEVATPMGYGHLLLRDYAQFMKQSERNHVNEVDALALDNSKLDFLGVKYLLVDKSFDGTIQEVESYPKYSLVYEVDDVKIYENTKVWPRLFLIDRNDQVSDEGIKEVFYSPNRIDLGVEASQDSELILTDTYYPGWQALVDQGEIKIKKYNQIFRSIKIEKGDHQVSFVFKPKLFYFGLKISLIAFVCLFIGLMKKMVFKR